MAILTIYKKTSPGNGKNFPFRLCELTKWGSNGAGNGQFSTPSGVAVDGNGNVYVSDANNSRIQKFDSNGGYLSQWGRYGSYAVPSGGLGGYDSSDGRGQFFYPRGLAVDGSGNVYVADSNNNRIQKFDSNGAYVAQWGSLGSGDGQLNQPSGVAVDGAGNVYVADTNNNRIQKFDSTGKYVAKWGAFSTRPNMPDLNFPRGVAVDAAGNNYVADTMNYRIQRFDASGNYLGEWRRYGRDASGFYHPFGIAVDAAGFIYVADGGRNRIEKFDANGNHLDRWSVKGSGPGTASPLTVAVGKTGKVYVAESSNHRIVMFSPVTSFTLEDGYGEQFNALPAGTYYVGELTIDRWVVGGIKCTGANSGGSPDFWGDGVEITLGVDDVTCTFTNSDVVAPTVAITPTMISGTNVVPINFRVVFSEPVSGFEAGDVTLGGTAGATTAALTEIAPNDRTTYNVAVSGMTRPGTVIVTVNAGVAQDAAGNVNEAATSTTIYDTAPAVTINRASGQAGLTNNSPINFTVVFNEPVTGFDARGVALWDGTAGATTAVVTQVAPNDGTTYNVAVSDMTRDGTVIASVIAGVARDAAGNVNEASTSTDNSVTYFYGPLKVLGVYPVAAEPNSSSPIVFQVRFNRPVTGFEAGAVTLGGTAGAKAAVVTEVAPNDGTTYNAVASGMTGDGTVIATVDAGVVQDAAGNLNEASPPADNNNTATYEAPKVLMIYPTIGSDPTNVSPIVFQVIFNRPVTGFGPDAVTVGGTAGARMVVVTPREPTAGEAYNVIVGGMTSPGTVILNVKAGAVKDRYGYVNVASTPAGGNQVTYEP